MAMRLSKDGVLFIGHWEGKGDGQPNEPGLQPYICPAGVATVGYGHVLYHPQTGKMLRRSLYGKNTLALARQAMLKEFGRDFLTDRQAEELLDKDCDKFEAVVNKYVGIIPTSQGQFDAMVSLAFNVGEANFRGSTVLKRHLSMRRDPGNMNPDHLRLRSHAGQIASQSEAFCAWARSNGDWLFGLFKRRYAEALTYFGTEPLKAILRAEELRH